MLTIKIRLHFMIKNIFHFRFDYDFSKPEDMYGHHFLSTLRFCTEGEYFFFKGKCYAEMSKKVQYTINLKMTKDVTIEGSHCDCPGGADGSAHCKHIVVVLLALVDLVNNKRIKLRKTCTEVIQNFHQPKQLYFGTPIKANKLFTKNRKHLNIVYDPREIYFRKGNVKDRVHNICGPSKLDMPIKHLLKPANPYAIKEDHCYCFDGPKMKFLKSINLIDVTLDDILRIEFETSGQHENLKWCYHKSFRMTTSNFHDILKSNSEDAKKN